MTTTTPIRGLTLATEARLAQRIADAMWAEGYDEHLAAVAGNLAWEVAASLAGADEVPDRAMRTAVVAVLRERAGRMES